MNIKQITVLAVALIAIVGVTLLMPQYKIQYIDTKNFIVTEQSSPLFERSRGQTRRHWNRILPIAGGVLFVSGILCFVLRDKRG
ncbi:MAG: hypothetical protein ACM3L6_07715 [Deltaproteobacteria bacterium]